MSAMKIFRIFSFILLSIMVNGCVSREPEAVKPATSGVKSEKTVVSEPQAAKPEPAPETKPVDAIAAARANISSNPMSWRAVNMLGLALFKTRQYAEAALVFEQAIAMFPIASAAETEQQVKEARQLAIKAQLEANRKVQKQQAQARQQMQEQQMLSGMLSMMPMMPGATANTALLAQAGQTMLNVAMAPSGMDIMSEPMLAEAESSQVLRTRELSMLYANLGQVRMALWEDDAALEAFRQAYATDPSRTDLFFIQASILQRNDDLAGAISLYARYLAVAPEIKQPVAWLEIAESCRNLGMEDETRNALAATRKAWNQVVGESASPTTEHRYGEILAVCGFYKEAIPHLQAWASSSLNDSASRREWATALFRAGKMEEALKTIKIFTQDAKSTSSDGGFSTYFTGMIEMHLGNLDKAKEILEELRPAAGATSGFAVAAYAMCGHLDEEKEWISRIENGLSSPDTASVDWYRLGCVWLVAGNISRAAECVGRSIAIQPEFGPALLLREQILSMNSERVKSGQVKAAQAVSSGDITSGIQILSSVLTDMPTGDSLESLTREGMKYVSNLQSKPRMPKEAQQYYLRAQAILKNAKSQQAVKEALCQCQWALRYAPLSPEIHLSLSSIYATQKQFKKALYHIQAYLAGSQPSDNLDAVVERYYELQYLNENELRRVRAIIPENN
jgi:tetratricopeptide (TPR) repeat protein